MRGSLVTDTSAHVRNFVNADLVAGVLTVTHSFGRQYIIVQVYDNDGLQITPDEIDLVNTTTTTIDLTSFGALTGTWTAVLLDSGSTITNVSRHNRAFVNADLVAGVLTHTHSLNEQYVHIQVYDNTDKMIMPDSITLTSATIATIDLTSFGAIAGTWHSIALI
jgi:hypothetical protein